MSADLTCRAPGGGPRRPPVLQWIYDQRTRSKIVATALLGALVALGVGAVGLTASARASSQVQTLSDVDLQRIGTIGDMRALLGDERVAVRDAVIAVDRAGAEAALDRVGELQVQFDTAAAEVRAGELTDEQRTALDEAVAGFDGYVDLVETTLGPLAVAGDDEAWLAANDEQVAPLIETTSAAVDDLRADVLAEARASADDLAGEQRLVQVLVAVLVVGGTALAVTAAVLISRGIEGGMRDVRDVALALADGDLTKASGYGSRCELGEMSAAMDTAVQNLRGVMREVAASADAVAASSDELSSSSARIAESSEATSGRATVVSSAAGEVTRSVVTVASSSEQMGASIREISSNADEAARVAAEAVRAVADTSATAVRLGESSQQIGEVVKLITSIAEQTNLLALNATIEAARAGAAGKGFAVVAAEVKDLAQETARATEGIARQVDGIQGDTAGIVDAIGRIGAVIEQIDSYQTSIASAVEEQTATTNEMVRSATEAASSSAEIAATIEDVSSAAAVTSDSLTQTRTTVDGLARRAAVLRGTVGRFTY
ncbi:methyl-accepting chemotaxis protein [uncultured Pseudokineococcus sp.]|uniref:methyl-accepting chemotaxis protein n=1 Tax=uncultured Pseudokineococcus sp. TaxID=1642928 RepID=UPI00260A03CB|nr:methyl-accepting chemotaxis protein [uncultured Pseudokineococcus sp.]